MQLKDSNRRKISEKQLFSILLSNKVNTLLAFCVRLKQERIKILCNIIIAHEPLRNKQLLWNNKMILGYVMENLIENEIIDCKPARYVQSTKNKQDMLRMWWSQKIQSSWHDFVYTRRHKCVCMWNEKLQDC